MTILREYTPFLTVSFRDRRICVLHMHSQLLTIMTILDMTYLVFNILVTLSVTPSIIVWLSDRHLIADSK